MWRDYRMCRDLNITYQQLREMPEFVLGFWERFMAGEAQARKTLAERARQKASVKYV
jgi:hypothetical protein